MEGRTDHLASVFSWQLCIHPGVQSAHSVCPASAWNLPAGQLAHSLSPSTAVTVPGAQMVGVTAPSGHAEPAGHVVQSLCAAPPVVLR